MPPISHHRPSDPTARATIQKSQLSAAALNQTQGLGDVDLQKLVLYMRNVLNLDGIELVTDVQLDRTIEGASTVTVSVTDDEDKLFHSGRLARGLDIEIDGLWFRLCNVRGQDVPNMDLVFEDREVNVLRTYQDKLGPVARTKTTRAEFVLRMLKEPIELTIDYFIPELHDVQPIQKTKKNTTYTIAAQNQKQGVPKGSGGYDPADVRHHQDGQSSAGLSVKSVPATNAQIAVANDVLGIGAAMNANRKVLVVAIMVAIQESKLKNLRADQSPDGKHIGVFQQDPRYWPASRNIVKDAAAFFSKAIGYDRTYPHLSYYALGEMVQNSGVGELYAQWRTEAERWVTTYGVPGGDSETTLGGSGTTGGSYFYYRGVPPSIGTQWGLETSWDCLQRLASDVQWRCFCVAGTVYFVTEDWLFKSQPAAVVKPGTPGVLSRPNFDLDENKRYATITMTVDTLRWAAPPGTVVAFQDYGPLNGRYLVTQVSRSLFKTTATITLKKPLPELPEPAQANLQAAQLGQADESGQTFRTGGALVNPIPTGQGGTHGAKHETEGLPGFPAYDFFAKAGTPVLAPERCRVVRLSGHDPSLGPINAFGQPGGLAAAGGPLGWSIYLEGIVSGTTYFMTHLGSRSVQVGQLLPAATQIGTVADYDKWGRKSHVHVGVSGGTITVEDLGSAPQAVKA